MVRDETEERETPAQLRANSLFIVHEIIESFRLEKTFKVIESNR